MIASGSRRAITAAARPIAAQESRGDGSTRMLSSGSVGQLAGHGGGVRDAGDHEDVVRGGQRRQPLDRRLQQRRVGAGQRVQELRVTGPRQRPQTSTAATCGDDRVQGCPCSSAHAHASVTIVVGLRQADLTAATRVHVGDVHLGAGVPGELLRPVEARPWRG